VSSPQAPRAVGRLAGLRRPVIPVLVLAGVFDWLSGNPIHSILLFGVAAALVREEWLGRAPAVARPVPLPPVGASIMIALLYAILIGEFGRYSWPATLAVLAPATTGLLLGWGGPLVERPAPDPPQGRGGVAWTAVFVSLGLWELAALLLQPSLTTDSYAHPTISVLTDPILASHLGRSVALFLWLGLGWFLVTS
jgi:hypothetical protein